MKKILILVIVLFSANFTNAQWNPLNSGTSEVLTSVFFTNANTGYVTGISGSVFKTLNAGASWDKVYNGFAKSLFSIFFTDVDTGFAVGEKGMILKTCNAGTSWINLTFDSTISSFKSVFFINSRLGYIVGSDAFHNGIIYKTINGGLTWIYQDPGVPQALTSVFFTDANNGYVTGLTGQVIKTVDGGVNWAGQNLGVTYNLNSIVFTDFSTGYLLGYNSSGSGTSIVFKTTNSGLIWNNQTTLSSYMLNGAFFTSYSTGYVVAGNGSILRTNDGGTNWVNLNSGNINYLNDVHFTDGLTGYAVGSGGIILKTTNGGGNEIGELNKDNLDLSISPNPATDYIIISYNNMEHAQVSINSIIGGEIVHCLSIDNKKTKIDISTLAKGVYFVKVNISDAIIQKKIIIY